VGIASSPWWGPSAFRLVINCLDIMQLSSKAYLQRVEVERCKGEVVEDVIEEWKRSLVYCDSGMKFCKFKLPNLTPLMPLSKRNNLKQSFFSPFIFSITVANCVLLSSPTELTVPLTML